MVKFIQRLSWGVAEANQVNQIISVYVSAPKL